MQDTAVKAAASAGKAEILKLPGHQYAIVTADGVGGLMHVPPDPRSHRLHSIDYAIRFAQQYGGGIAAGATAGLLDGPAGQIKKIYGPEETDALASEWPGPEAMPNSVQDVLTQWPPRFVPEALLYATATGELERPKAKSPTKKPRKSKQTKTAG
jgi:hypothetical protein